MIIGILALLGILFIIFIAFTLGVVLGIEPSKNLKEIDLEIEEHFNE